MSGGGGCPAASGHPQVALARSGALDAASVVAWMARDELRAACQAHDLPSTSRARHDLAASLLGAHDDAPPPSLRRALSDAPTTAEGLPAPGAIALVRHRQYLVKGLAPGAGPDEATRVDLVCLDDDAQGRRLSVLWELERGARVLAAEAEGLGSGGRVDPARHFAAY